jgi:hypothetical protein
MKASWQERSDCCDRQARMAIKQVADPGRECRLHRITMLRANFILPRAIVRSNMNDARRCRIALHQAMGFCLTWSIVITS